MSGYASKGSIKVIYVNGKTFGKQEFQGEHSREYTLVEYVNGEPQEDMYLYDHGVLKFHWKMKDGVRNGTFRVYKNGKLEKQTEWNYFVEYRDALPWFFFREDNKMLMMLENVSTGHIVYRGEYDERLTPNGYGIEYDPTTGKPIRSGLFKDGQMVDCHQEFMEEEEEENSSYGLIRKRQVMIEYNRAKLGEDLVHKCPVYVGGYMYDQTTNEYVRHGNGNVMDEHTGLIIRCGMWNRGEEKERQGRDGERGWDGYLESDDYKAAIIALIGESRQMRKELSVLADENRRLCEELSELKSQIKPLVEGKQDLSKTMRKISEQCEVEMNSNNLQFEDLTYNIPVLSSLWIDQLQQLKSIHIGNECCQYVRDVTITELPQIEEILIGKCSFSKHEVDELIVGVDGRICISHCPKLQRIEIADHSFRDYHQFEIRGVYRLIDYCKMNDK